MEIRRSSVRAAIISVTNAWISIKFWLLVPLDYTRRHFFFNFSKKHFNIFLRIFFVFVNMGPNGSKNFQPILIQIAADSFQNTPGVERECMCNFRNFGQWPSFMPKYLDNHIFCHIWISNLKWEICPCMYLTLLSCAALRI